VNCFELIIGLAAPQSQPGGGGANGGLGGLLVPILLIFAVFYFIALRPKQREQKQRQQMLDNLKKYDKVLTIGGIIGTVMEVREDEVILKVDDNSNTRLKFMRGSIQKILSGEEKEKSPK